MSAVHEVIDSEIERVERWRVEELIRAGYDPLAAAQIAPRSDIDLHQAIGLLAHGCPVDLAVRQHRLERNRDRHHNRLIAATAFSFVPSVRAG